MSPVKIRVPLGAVLRCALLPVVTLPPLALRALHVAGIVGVLVAEQVEETAADVRAAGEMAVALVVFWRES